MTFEYKKRIETHISDETIGKLLDSLKMERAFFTDSSFSSPWSIDLPAMPNCMMFHLVLSGKSHFEIEGETFDLSTGDFILFPKGEGHRLSDGTCQQYTNLNALPIKAVSARYETLTFGGGGAQTKMICGVLLFQHPLTIKLLGILPTYIKIDADNREAISIVESLNHLLNGESKIIGVGAEAVVTRLSEVLVITAMRQYLKSLNGKKLGWLGALEDDRIGKSLSLIHDSPEKHWSLEGLAQSIGMSRTSFVQEFKRLVGNTPMDYLSEWRMSLAYARLQLTKDTVLSIALDVGYQSEAAFSRAFKKIIGKPPGEVRKAYQTNTDIKPEC
ncbi:AraC family transcriptional regulator [Planctobacterium marinum]|uniref:AraC family transcriptional regulator n=1 Tax=Planctobacterium marinum TaxID=1631968 RepID=UPI001E6068ED|nr:AraC family transcriptional regulator [Planctobacterium marinum]MCC2604709.1 AraC family transcriptional regulator [Planctobacterium marinum]